MNNTSTPLTFTIPANRYLSSNARAFYHTDYFSHLTPGNPDYLNDLKNTFNDFLQSKLGPASQKLKSVLLIDLPIIFRTLRLPEIHACTIPRSKAQHTYGQNQLLFKSTVSDTIRSLGLFRDGTSYITRHTNTRTTHFRTEIPNYDNDGPHPYPGITRETCTIQDVSGKNILLIDDIYTDGVGIAEDAIQALRDNGARDVIYYSIGKTLRGRPSSHEIF